MSEVQIPEAGKKGPISRRPYFVQAAVLAAGTPHQAAVLLAGAPHRAAALLAAGGGA